MDTALYGVWDLGGTWIEITEGDRGPEVRLPGTQPGFAPLLGATRDPTQFVLRGSRRVPF